MVIKQESLNMDPRTKKIFRDNSTSYYYSSLFFPKETRKDVFKLYAYVRKADDFVDKVPQDIEGFNDYRDETFSALEGEKTDDWVIQQFVELTERKKIQKEWIKAFLDSMEKDLHKSRYETLDETLEYIYGSAEVIGLMMTRILELEEESEKPAKMLGRAMQYCNFIRDIKEDNTLGRQYLPKEDMERHGLENLEHQHVEDNKDAFESFMHEQIERYWKWEEKGVEGFKMIPYRTRIPVMVSADLYEWTAEKIRPDPLIVYDRKVRPSKTVITGKLIKNLRGF